MAIEPYHGIPEQVNAIWTRLDFSSGRGKLSMGFGSISTELQRIYGNSL